MQHNIIIEGYLGDMKISKDQVGCMKIFYKMKSAFGMQVLII